MKIRNGFVSNSSSSSFVIVGYELKDSILETIKKIYSQDELDKWAKKNKYDEFNESSAREFMWEIDDIIDLDGQAAYIGQTIAHGDECGLSESIVDIEDVISHVKEKYSKLELGKIKIITGERPC